MEKETSGTKQTLDAHHAESFSLFIDLALGDFLFGSALLHFSLFSKACN